MKKDRILLGTFLILLSVGLHALHFAIFKDMHHILIFLLADLAFIPLEVFFVSMVLDNLIEKREHSKIVKKINMIVGLFYQELGNKLLSIIVHADENINSDDITVNYSWNSENYNLLKDKIKNHKHNINIDKINLADCESIIERSHNMITNLIMNQALQEHEKFTDVLMSVFHLSEELKQRPLKDLTVDDLEHLKFDIVRVYTNLSLVWVEYLQYLQEEYPYLFLTAVTNNPYDKRQRAVIEKEVLSQS